MSQTLSWDRLLWGVMFSGAPGEQRLIGSAWLDEPPIPYEGEPTRALLFCSRAQARAWCTAQMREWQQRGDFVRTWTVRPVRVRETVKPCSPPPP